MPHLTSWCTRPAPTNPGELGLGVPGCAHPLVAPAEWTALARPLAPLHWAVLNVARGPGTWPDPHCLEAAARLRAAGGRLLGHLDLRYGTRPLGEVLAEAGRFLEWYRVDGFSLQRCPADRAGLGAVRRTTASLRALCETAHLVFRHDTHPYPGYVELADQLVTFAGSWADYRWSQAAEWTAELAPERFCHLVHSLPLGHLEEALRIARWQGAATVWFTDRTDRGDGTEPWEALPGYWDEIVSRLETGVSE
ncbi:spherulation-specific family 4 protein [Streptomyces sp. TP-A0874]|uniref:spherulation-specific family 4 protein n=1 Tax=Streptomyces sp. TP-A0874 TaxID=549819 RepID=UPI0008538237|nr:spherulation-specific family 4 protein [Streptomyces sp. TP-A0874]